MQTVKIHDQIVDLKDTKNLYGRLIVLTRSNRDIDQKNAVGNYEFTLTPRALFAPDGSMLPCTDKSKLIHSLEKLANTDETNEQTETPAANEQGDAREILHHLHPQQIQRLPLLMEWFLSKR